MAGRTSWGTVRKLPSGRYQIRYRVDGERRLGDTTSRRCAMPRRRWLLSDIERSMWHDPKRAKETNFRDHASTWLEQKKPSLAPRLLGPPHRPERHTGATRPVPPRACACRRQHQAPQSVRAGTIPVHVPRRQPGMARPGGDGLGPGPLVPAPVPERLRPRQGRDQDAAVGALAHPGPRHPQSRTRHRPHPRRLARRRHHPHRKPAHPRPGLNHPVP